ncbi:MAG: hypothetical protein PHO02_00910 [Candidatus Nanoarchaeia archaeon]|nr:hypothetical protein [Candidatus Nanoarchaeia archaeon]
MERKELTDLLVNSVKGASFTVENDVDTDNCDAAGYLRMLDSYYKLGDNEQSCVKSSYFRKIQDHLVSINDIKTEGLINEEFLKKVNYCQKASGIGSLLIIAMPVNPYVGALGMGCLSTFIGITWAKIKAKKKLHFKELEQFAEESKELIGKLKAVDYKELAGVLEEAKPEIMPYLGKDI